MKRVHILLLSLTVAMILATTWGTSVSAETVPAAGTSFDVPLTPTFDGVTPLLTPSISPEAPCCFAVYGVWGTLLTVSGADAYVVLDHEPWDGVDGVLYEAIDGVVTLALSVGNPRMPVYFQIGTYADHPVSYSYTFTYPEGSMNNPISVKDHGVLTVAQEDNATDAVYYTYTATQGGLLTFFVTSEAANGIEQRISFFNIIKASGGAATFPEDIVNGSGSFAVEAGDVIAFCVAAGGRHLPMPEARITVLITLTLPDGTVLGAIPPLGESSNLSDIILGTMVCGILSLFAWLCLPVSRKPFYHPL